MDEEALLVLESELAARKELKALCYAAHVAKVERLYKLVKGGVLLAPLRLLFMARKCPWCKSKLLVTEMSKDFTYILCVCPGCEYESGEVRSFSYD